MKAILIGVATVILAIQLVGPLAISPAIAISVDLAKKCRDMAVKAHPPALAGTTPYAAAERDFFRTCVSNDGQVDDNGQPIKAPANQH
jgi:hypothetical protein